MSKFIHADLIALYAQDAMECTEPWLRWQHLVVDRWIDVTNPLAFLPSNHYRRKPKTILINGFEVPEPVRKPLEHGQEYWVSDITNRIPHRCRWGVTGFDLRWLAAGLIHLDKESAQIHIDALLSFTKRSE